MIYHPWGKIFHTLKGRSYSMLRFEYWSYTLHFKLFSIYVFKRPSRVELLSLCLGPVNIL